MMRPTLASFMSEVHNGNEIQWYASRWEVLWASGLASVFSKFCKRSLPGFSHWSRSKLSLISPNVLAVWLLCKCGQHYITRCFSCKCKKWRCTGKRLPFWSRHENCKSLKWSFFPSPVPQSTCLERSKSFLPAFNHTSSGVWDKWNVFSSRFKWCLPSIQA